MENPYIIIGCQPRGASVYMRTVLRQLGLEVGHEKPERDGVVGWQHLHPSHPWTMEALKKAKGRKRVWLMQMRHPVPTINSMAAMYFRGDWPPLAGGVPVSHMFRMEPDDTPIVKAMKLYYHVNIMGFRDVKFKIRYHIEDIDAEWPVIADAIGLPDAELPDVPQNTNTHKDMGKYPNLEWPDICDAHPLYGQYISRLAGQMGYNVHDWQNTELSKWAAEQENDK